MKNASVWGGGKGTLSILRVQNKVHMYTLAAAQKRIVTCFCLHNHYNYNQWIATLSDQDGARPACAGGGGGGGYSIGDSLGGFGQHLVGDGQQLHDPLVQVQILQTLEQVRVAADR